MKKTKNKYRLFGDARKFVRKLGLNREEWLIYIKSPDFPKDIRKNPLKYTRWKGWGNWLGYNEADYFKKRSFLDAREYARTLGLNTRLEWKEHIKKLGFPDDIRRNPLLYGSWGGWCDWLGRKEIIKRPFGQAREWVRTLGLKSHDEWKEYTKRDDFPEDIRKHPYNYDEWISMCNWLGNERRSFKDARKWVISLELKNTNEWYEYTKREDFPEDILKTPKIYVEFQGMSNWLGNKSDEVLPMLKVMEIIRPFNLKNSKEYIEWWERNEKYCIMRGIPKYPGKEY